MSQTLSKLIVVFCSDTEDNHPNYLPGWNDAGSDYDRNPARVCWTWTRYWGNLAAEFRRLKIPVTWLIRVDDGPVHDEMIREFREQILMLKASGDEIGIHIHTFEWSPSTSRWVQTLEPAKEKRIVERSVKSFKLLGFAPLSARMGWNAMSNAILDSMEDSGILVDASALPSYSSSGKFGKRDNFYDWRRSPDRPYHPSHNDYQQPGARRILEMPIATIPRSSNGTKLSQMINELTNLSLARRALMPMLGIPRYLGLTPSGYLHISPYWSVATCKRIIEYYSEIARSEGIAFLLAYLHPSDILNPKNSTENSGFMKKISAVGRHMKNLSGVDTEFCTLSDAAARYELAESARSSITETNAHFRASR